MNEKNSSKSLGKMLFDDSGFALAVVMLMSSILFLLATTVVMLSTYNSKQTSAVIKRNQAMQVADAGINEYMYILSQDPNFWYKDGGVLGPTGTPDGTWTVTPSTTPSGSVVLTSVGMLKNGYTRTVKADINFPNWAKYIMLVNGPISIGSGAVMDGDVHSNQGISNAGVVTGFASTVSGYHCTVNGTTFANAYPGLPRPGYTDTADYVDFSQLTKDLNDLKNSALDGGSYYAAAGSGFLGYDVVLNDSQVTIYKVSAIERDKPRVDSNVGVQGVIGNPVTINPPDPPLGTLTKTLVGTVAVPSEGVFFFDDDVWVSGRYSVGVTICSYKNIWVRDSILPKVAGQTQTCGLIAEYNILFPWWYQTMSDQIVVQAALLSQTGGIGQDNLDSPAANASPTGDLTKWTKTEHRSGTVGHYTYTYTWDPSLYNPPDIPLKTKATIKGSQGMVRSLGFTITSGSTQIAGFASRSYEKDPVLKNNPPPRYPKLPGKGLQVVTWSDQK